MVLDLSSMALTGTTATAVDLDHRIFSDLPVVFLCWIKNILFLKCSHSWSRSKPFHHIPDSKLYNWDV